MLYTTKLAIEIKKIAIEIDKEAIGNVKQMPVYVSDDDTKGESPGLSNYKTFLYKLEQQRAEPESASALRYLNFFKFLFENITATKTPINKLVHQIQKLIDDQNKKETFSKHAETPFKTATDMITSIRRVLKRYDLRANRYVAVKLLKEILNYGVANGMTSFLRLFTMPNRFWSQFNAQTEKREIKHDIKEQK
jgi:hypothetical protein